MVTLTYPGDWEVAAPDGASVKRHMVLWRKRFQREYGEPARYIWKLEFQRRGAPHIHLWMAPPMSPGRSGRSFGSWLSDASAQGVDHPDAEQKARHRLAGTAIDVRNGLKACDPKRLAVYFTKHSSPNLHGDKEYQHIVPELWQQPGHGPGRFWGVYGLKKALAVVEIAQDAYLAARRIVRRWSHSQAMYGNASSRFPSTVVPRTAVRLVARVESRYRRCGAPACAATTDALQPRRIGWWLRASQQWTRLRRPARPCNCVNPTHTPRPLRTVTFNPPHRRQVHDQLV